MGAIFTNIAEIFANSGWAQIFFAEGGWKYAVMIGVACVLLYLAIVHQFGYDNGLTLEFEGLEDVEVGNRIGLANMKRYWEELENAKA